MLTDYLTVIGVDETQIVAGHFMLIAYKKSCLMARKSKIIIIRLNFDKKIEK